jgi:hypothetical protein
LDIEFLKDHEQKEPLVDMSLGNRDKMRAIKGLRWFIFFATNLGAGRECCWNAFVENFFSKWQTCFYFKSREGDEESERLHHVLSNSQQGGCQEV